MEMKSSNLPDFAQIQDMLRNRDCSMREVSEGTGLSRATLMKLQAGSKKNPTLRTMQLIVSFFADREGAKETV